MPLNGPLMLDLSRRCAIKARQSVRFGEFVDCPESREYAEFDLILYRLPGVEEPQPPRFPFGGAPLHPRIRGFDSGHVVARHHALPIDEPWKRFVCVRQIDRDWTFRVIGHPRQQDVYLSVAVRAELVIE